MRRMLLLAGCCALGTAWAESTLTIGVAPGYPGATTTLPVNLNGATNAVALQLDVSFNGSRASLQSVLRGTRLTNHLISRLAVGG